MRTSLFLIIRYSKRIISKVLISFIRADTEDLILNEVVIIEGSYVNIILKALIIKVRA